MEDHSEWLRMRARLWPAPQAEHSREIGDYFREESSMDPVITFVAEVEPGKLAGFAEASLRPWAEGCSDTPVPYLEGWYVDEEFRGSGIGGNLVNAVEAWARKMGFDELASDTEIENTESQQAHYRLGFEKIETIICFMKKLKR